MIYREVVDFEFDGLGGVCGVEDGILSFGWVRYEEVAVEILYEVVELCASEWVQFLFCVCGDDAVLCHRRRCILWSLGLRG